MCQVGLCISFIYLFIYLFIYAFFIEGNKLQLLNNQQQENIRHTLHSLSLLRRQTNPVTLKVSVCKLCNSFSMGIVTPKMGATDYKRTSEKNALRSTIIDQIH